MRMRATGYQLPSLVLGTMMVALAFGGCVSSQPPTQTGVRIGDETLKQFKAGVTTEDWLRPCSVRRPTETCSQDHSKHKGVEIRVGRSGGRTWSNLLRRSEQEHVCRVLHRDRWNRHALLGRPRRSERFWAIRWKHRPVRSSDSGVGKIKPPGRTWRPPWRV